MPGLGVLATASLALSILGVDSGSRPTDDDMYARWLCANMELCP